MLPLLANSLWYASSLPEAIRFQYATRHVAETQRAYLLALLRANAKSDIGRRYGFADIRTPADFQDRLPLATYETYRGEIEAMAAGEPHRLTTQAVTLFEPTSGSSGATKLIPYTPTLQAEFQRGIAAWIADLFGNDLRLLRGRAYWSVSPVAQGATRTAGGIPIGFEEDSAYLGRQSGLVQSVLAVPALVKHISDMPSFRYVTLLFLLRAADLTLMSVWNPTFLTLLMEALHESWEALAADIERGTVTPSHPLTPAIQQVLQAQTPPDPRRAATIRTIFRSEPTPAARHAALWQGLRLVSAWADGNATPYATQLAALFPHATFQAKGLLATEGFISFPLVGQGGAALAVRSHFFEFLPQGDDESRPALAHELEQGSRYDVLLTTGGGLYRYRLFDTVEIVGFHHQCPLLRFIGKSALVSDWFGEKLNEQHVREVVTTCLAAHSISPTFALLAYDSAGGSYGLYLESEQVVVGQSLIDEIEAGLQQNFHYRYCRQLGQLAAVRLFRIEQGAAAAYQARCIALGQRAGDIKPAFLHRADGWTTAFRGAWLA